MAAPPDRGELVWLSFSPQAGREQAGRRPALILTPAAYNGRTSLALVCPITSRIKGYPFEVRIEKALGRPAVVLVDHMRSIDWRARKAERIGRAPAGVLDEVMGKLGTLLGL